MAGMTYEQLMSQQNTGDKASDSFDRGLTFEELQAQARPAPSDFQKGLGNVAMLADMALNLPSDAFGVVANTGARIGGLLAGEDRRESAQAAQRIQVEAQELAGKVGLIRDPAKKLLSALGLEGAYDKGYVGQAMGAISEGISKGGTVIERGTGGAVLKEDVEHMAETLMTFGGPGAIYHGGKAMLQKAKDRAKAAPTASAEPTAPDLLPEHPGDINFDRPLTSEEAGTRTKVGKVKRPGQPYSSLREVSPEQKESVSRALEFEARNIQRQLGEMQPDEAGQLPPKALELQQRFRGLEEEYAGLNREPSSPLARETVYGNEFGEFPEGKNPDLAEPNVQPGIDVAPFVAERRAQPLVDRIREERQAQVDSGFRTKEGDIEQAWQQHKAEQARAEELDARRESMADIEENLTRRPLVNQKGAIDQDLLVKIGLGAAATTAGLYAYSRPDQQKDIATAAAAVGGVLATRGKIPASVLAKMPTRALGPLLADGKYTLKTLDRLPQNATEFHPAQIRQELNKPGTPAAEKTALEGTIARAEAEGRKVTAQELVSDFRMKTGDHTLTPRETREYSDFGLSSIRSAEKAQPKTIIWQFPEHLEVATTNHFGDPRYYGHTREFREAGVDHVMEIQSDLAQGVRKPLTPEQRAAIREELAALEVSDKAPRPDLTREQKLRWQELRMSLLRDKTTQAVKDTGVAPALKNAENRLIREKLAEAAAKGDESVRFASADTVAKVEGWQDNHAIAQEMLNSTRIVGYNRDLLDIDTAHANKLLAAPRFENPGHQSLYDRYAKETTSYLKKLGGKEITDAEGHTWWEVPTGAKLEGPDVWAAVDRLKEVDRRLKAIKLKPVYMTTSTTELRARAVEADVLRAEQAALLNIIHAAEAATKVVAKNPGTGESRPFGGRSDIEGQGPIEMYGNADPRLLAAIAATGLATATYIALPDEQKEGVKNYLQAVGALAAVGTVGKKLKGSAATEFKVDLVKLAEPDYKARQRLIEMPISDFLKLAKQDSVDARKAQHIATLRKTGEKFNTVPYLYFNVEGSVAKITGHEGRHRARQLADEGYTTIPVDFRGPIRWSEQADPNNFDYKKIWPSKLIAESGNAELPFPISRENAASAWTPESVFTGLKSQQGSITPEQAVKFGALTTGAAVGGYLAGDEAIAGMVIGGIAGLAATRLPALGRTIGKVISPQQAFGTAMRISAALGLGYYLGGKVDHPVEGAAIASALLLGRKFMKPALKRESDAALNIHDGNIAVWETIIHNTKREIDSQVPDPARREAIAEALQVGARNSLAPNERAVFDMVTEMNAITGRDAIDARVLRSLRENYITSILEFKPTASKTERQLLIDKIIGRMETRESAGSGTRFARQRKYDTFSELNRAIDGTDLQIKTKDVGEILELYTRSMRKAIEDRILIDFHKTAKASDGLPYVAKADSYGRFPAGFREIKHPQLKKLAVHPEAYDGLRVVLENYQPGIVMAGLFGLSMAIKRSNVFGSLFHAKSLAEVYVLGMGTEMLPRPGDLKRSKRVIDEALKQFHEGGLGDHIEGLNRNGLKLEVPDDVSTTIIGDLGKLANTTFETQLGTAVTDKIDFVNKKTDKLTWDYMHTGVKLALALDAVAKFKKNNAELHAMNPEKYPLKSMDEIYADAARYANDATGGLDWLRIATEAKTELGRSVAMNFASPRGRKMAQILLFAPDWTVSTLRAGFNSFGKSDTGFRGLLKPTNAVDMYRRYALRSAALWFTVINGIQYALTGKPVWENDDPTRIQFDDGTSMQPGKHSAEAVHAAMDPVKFAMNKLGFVPSLGADLASARWGAGPLAISGDSPTWHTVKKMAPFAASPMLQEHLEPGQRVGRSISGALGMPVYGMTPRQKMLARQERMREAAQKRGER